MTSTVFLLLLTGHLLGDWVAQSDWQATNKTRSWAALAAHLHRAQAKWDDRPQINKPGGERVRNEDGHQAGGGRDPSRGLHE